MLGGIETPRLNVYPGAPTLLPGGVGALFCFDSPQRFVVENMPEFGEAFGCKKGQPMVPEDVCRVW